MRNKLFYPTFGGTMRSLIAASLAFALAGCSADLGPRPSQRLLLPATLVVIDGQGQQVVAGSALPKPILVRAERDGVTVPAMNIWFRWTQPNSWQSTGQIVYPDATGVASFNFTNLGTPGPFTITIEYKECNVWGWWTCDKYKLLTTTMVTGTIVAR